MKFLLTMLAYLGFAVLLGWGFLLAASGKGMILLGVALVAFFAVFIKAGCLASHD